MNAPQIVCTICAGAVAIFASWVLLRQRQLRAELDALRARVDRYRGEQKTDRADVHTKLTDLEPMRVREVARQRRRAEREHGATRVH